MKKNVKNNEIRKNFVKICGYLNKKRTTRERVDDVNLNTCNLRHGNFNDNRIQLNKGNIIRINPAKKFESNERQEIKNIIDKKEVYKVL